MRGMGEEFSKRVKITDLTRIGMNETFKVEKVV